MESYSYIYVAQSESFPEGTVKIGSSQDVEKRQKQLGRKTTIHCIYKVPIIPGEMLPDELLHKIIGDEKREINEFFRMTPEQAYNSIYTIARMTGTLSSLWNYGESGLSICKPSSDNFLLLEKLKEEVYKITFKINEWSGNNMFYYGVTNAIFSVKPLDNELEVIVYVDPKKIDMMSDKLYRIERKYTYRARWKYYYAFKFDSNTDSNFIHEIMNKAFYAQRWDFH